MYYSYNCQKYINNKSYKRNFFRFYLNIMYIIRSNSKKPIFFIFKFKNIFIKKRFILIHDNKLIIINIDVSI